MLHGGRVEVVGVHSDSQGTQQLQLCWEKNLLLSVCKGNENLMRLDFFFFQHLQPFNSLLHNRFPEEKHTEWEKL